MVVETWDLVYDKRPWTTNKDRTLHFQARAKLVREWRGEFKTLAEDAKIPPLSVMWVEVYPRIKDRRFQDTAACNPAAKAAIDGIVDAGVIPDDSPEWLKWITFYPCEVTPGLNSMMIRVFGERA